MNQSFKLTWILAVILIAIACGKTNTASESGDLSGIKNEVIAVHDTAMAKMDEIIMLKKDLEILQADTLDSTTNIAVERAIIDLETAHYNMMAWMHEFSANFPAGTLIGNGHENAHGSHGMAHEGMKEEQIDAETMNKALEAELPKIQKVSDDIDAAIASAKRLLGK